MSTAAWKQPMLWLAFGLPAAVVAAAVATIAVAAGDGSTDTVGDDVRRIAQVQIADVDADVEAARRGVRMQLRREAGGVVVQQVAGDVDAAEPLRLVLRHPARASGDLVAVPVAVAPRSRPGPLPQREATSNVGAAMSATGDAPAPPAWRAALSPSPTHAWNVELSGDGWRVVGRWPRDADTVELAPAWPAVANRP